MIVKTPQCDHFFHKACILKWVKTKIDKIMHPDCPQCRALFKPPVVENRIGEMPILQERDQAHENAPGAQSPRN